MPTHPPQTRPDGRHGSDERTTFALVRSLVARYERRDTLTWGELELNANERLFLLHLLEAGPCGVVQLAHWIGITTAAATVLAGRLERRGLLVRQPHPTDRRRVLLYPSKELHVHYRQATEHIERDLDALTAELDPRTRAQLRDVLDRAGDLLYAPGD